MKKPIFRSLINHKDLPNINKSQSLQNNTPYEHQRENFRKLLVLFPE